MIHFEFDSQLTYLKSVVNASDLLVNFLDGGSNIFSTMFNVFTRFGNVLWAETKVFATPTQLRERFRRLGVNFFLLKPNLDDLPILHELNWVSISNLFGVCCEASPSHFSEHSARLILDFREYLASCLSCLTASVPVCPIFHVRIFYHLLAQHFRFLPVPTFEPVGIWISYSYFFSIIRIIFFTWFN